MVVNNVSRWYTSKNMDIKRKCLFIIAIIALAGIFSCVVLEPAFAMDADSAATEGQDEGHCCFICHSMHHLWVAPDHMATGTFLHPVSDILPFDRFSLPDSLAKPIFHPPIAL